MASGNFDSKTRVWTGTTGAYQFPMDIFFGEKLLVAFDETPDRILQIDHDEGTSLTCKEVKLSSIRVAQNLLRLGIKADDVIGFVCRNSKNVVPLIYGCALIGAPINSLHISFSKDKIKQVFSQTRPCLVFCDNDVFETTKEALRDIKSSAILFTLLKKLPIVPYVNELLVPTGSEYHFKSPKFAKSAAEKLLAIVCSSAVTGPTKGVCMPHTAVMLFIDDKFKCSKEFRSLNFSSIYWCTGLIGIYLAPFRARETRISTTQPFSVELCIDLIETYKVTVIVLPPVHLATLINSSLVKTADFSSVLLFSCTGSIVSEHLRVKFKSTFPDKPLLISYGMTEVFIAALGPGDVDDGMRRVGKTYTNIQIKVVDEEGQALDITEVGEIYAKPEFKFQGYYNNPQSSVEAVDKDGFVKTGDIGYLDKDGYVYILDRNKDIFKYKDHLITPSEIENVIESIDGVDLVSVVGIPNQQAINLPAAVIVKRKGFESLSEHDILSCVAEKLSHCKQLYGGVYFVKEMPMTPNGKILRRSVREIAIAKFNSRSNI